MMKLFLARPVGFNKNNGNRFKWIVYGAETAEQAALEAAAHRKTVHQKDSNNAPPMPTYEVVPMKTQRGMLTDTFCVEGVLQAQKEATFSALWDWEARTEINL